MKLIYFVIFVGHFCACAWYFLGIYEVNSGHYSWIIEYKVLTVSNFEKYIYSLYWSNITLLTVGYGDIGPVTHLERIFVIIVALITCGVFGYAINNIGSIFKEMDEKREKFKN